MSRYGYLALPVVDELDRIVGVITADDLIEVAENEATEDMYRMVGISGEEERVFSPLWPSVFKRLPWLAVNMVTLFVAITVVDAFEEIIAGMVALATFLPLVSGEGGNAGSQTTTIIVMTVARMVIMVLPRTIVRLIDEMTRSLASVSMASMIAPTVGAMLVE